MDFTYLPETSNLPASTALVGIFYQKKYATVELTKMSLNLLKSTTECCFCQDYKFAIFGEKMPPWALLAPTG